MEMSRTSQSVSGGGGGSVEISKSSKSEGKMLKAEEVATMRSTSLRQESELDQQVIEEPPRSRRTSTARTGGLPPPGPMRAPVPDLSEVHGPLYPSERRHEFPKDTPVRVESKSKDELQFPVFVADGKHSCTEVPKAGEKTSTLTGPVMEVGHKHSFTKQETKEFDYKTLSGPVQSVGVDSKHSFNMMDSQAKPVEASLVKEQMYPVMESGHDSKFTGPTTSIKSVNTEVKDIQYPCMLNKRKFNTEMSGSSYAEVTMGQETGSFMGQETKVSTDLVGPLYDVATVHAFKGIVTHAHHLSELVGPVLGSGASEVERRHHYSELGKHAEQLKSLTLPVYDVDKKHGYEVIMKEAEKLVNIVGPVYPVEHGSKYTPTVTKTDTAPLMTGPKLTGVQEGNKYCPVTQKVVADAIMTGPVYPGVDARNAYGEWESARAEVGTGMTGPVYSSVAGGNQYSFQAPAVPGGDPQMFAPTMSKVSSESHGYGPVPARVAGVPQMAGPVMVEQGANAYCPVPARVAGSLATTGPVYPGVENKNSYSETPARVSGVPLMAGPVFPGVESKSGFNEVKARADLPSYSTHPCLPADAAHKFSGETLEPKFSVQTGQVYPVLDSGHSHAFREIVASAAAMAGFRPPKHDVDNDKHGYVYQPPVALGTVQEMLGPIYDVMQHHNYGQINTIVNELKTLTTPVYTPESTNHYQAILKNVEKLETLQTPVFDINRDHHYSEIMKSIDQIKQMNGRSEEHTSELQSP